MRFAHFLAPGVVTAVLLLSACAPAPIYKPAADTVAVSPAAAARAPAQFEQADVIWGGRIIKVTNLAANTEIELLAFPLDSSQRPETKDKPGGRFIAVVPGYLEPLNYPPGHLMTISGRIKGMRSGKVGAADYVFPLVQASQHHLWTAKEMRSPWSNIHFGVGIGTIF